MMIFFLNFPKRYFHPHSPFQKDFHLTDLEDLCSVIQSQPGPVSARQLYQLGLIKLSIPTTAH